MPTQSPRPLTEVPRGHDPTATRYDDMTRDELYELAQERDVPDRSTMNRDELQAALELHDRGPNAIDMLLGHHDEIRRLFTEFEGLSSRPSKRKEDLVAELITLLVKHAEVEEQVFYPAVRNEVAGQADEVDESLEEHHAAEFLLAELDGMSSDTRRYDMKVHVLKENMLHHLEEEEEDLFPDVREALSEERLREIGGGHGRGLGGRAAAAAPVLSPQSPPANVLLSLRHGAWDLAVSLTRVLRRRLLRR